MGAEILLVLQWIGSVLGALLIIDTTADAIAKSLGNKKWDTVLGQWAVSLNTAITATKSVAPVVPLTPTQPSSSAT